MLHKKKILFVSYGGGHIEIIKSIIESCVDFDKYEVDVIALTVAYNEISDPRIKKFRISDFDFLFKDEMTEIIKYGSNLILNDFNPNANIPKSELEFYLGVSFLELVSQVGLSKAESLYRLKKRQSFFPVNTLRRILEFLKPDIVFATNSPRMEAASILAAKRLHIKSIQILDLFGDDYIKPSADYIIVLNNFVKAKLESEGIKHTILPLGQPIFDKTIELVNNLNVSFLKTKFNISTSHKVLLFSPTRYYLWNEDLSLRGMGDDRVINKPIFKILESLVTNYNLVVIVRPHPVYDKVEDYIHYTTCPNIKFISSDKMSLYECLALSDMVLTYISTIAIQGKVCGKTVFTYNYDESQKYIIDSYTKPPFIFSSNYQSLEYNLHTFLANSQTREDSDFYTAGANSKIYDFLNRKLYYDLI